MLRSTQLLDQWREPFRHKHYSLRTGESYVHWLRFFVHWHGVKHPRNMGHAEVETFLNMPANGRKVSPFTRIYTHGFKVGAGQTTCPLDAVSQA